MAAVTLASVKLSNHDLSCELYEASSFSGKDEVAVAIDGKIVAVIAIEEKRDAVECKVVTTNKVRIPRAPATHPGAPRATLDIDGGSNATGKSTSP